jgi:hypothetical protein
MYVPTEADVLHAHAKSMGIIETWLNSCVFLPFFCFRFG